MRVHVKQVVRGYAVRVLEAIAERGDKAVLSALLTRVAHDPDPRYSVYLLYWYKITNTDAETAASSDVRYLAIRGLGKLAHVGDAAVEKAMLGILAQARLRIPARDTGVKKKRKNQ